MAILTISRQLESGGRDIGQAVADRMGYEYINRKIFFDDMREAGKQWEEWARHFDERFPNVWERYDWSYRGFIALNQSYALQYALKDRVVLMGRDGNFLLKGIPYVLRIRIQAPMNFRIERVLDREGVSRETARWLFEKVDEEMARSIYLVYGKDWDDPAEYDKVFDRSPQDFDEVISFIQKALSEKDRFNTEEAKSILRLRALAAKIKAELVIDPTLSISVLEVEPKEKELVEYGLILQAIVYNRDDTNRIKAAAEKLAGAVPIECKIRFQSSPRFNFWQYK